MNKIIHENDNYKVVQIPAPTDGDEYAVVNTTTGVIEKTSTCLPEAIGEAEQSNAYLKYEAWRWIDEQVKQQVEQATAWFGTEAEIDLDPSDPDDSGSQLLN